MTLETFTTPEAIKMLDYFGWPEGVKYVDRLQNGNGTWHRLLIHGKLHGKATLASIRDHLWSIIGERFDYLHHKRTFEGEVRHNVELHTIGEYDWQRDDHVVVVISRYDLDTLLVKTCTWIMEKEKENG